jgi:hypothetical protein
MTLSCRRTSSILAAGFAVGAFFHAHDSLACGGCFHEAPPPAQPANEATVVTDHRMAFSISPGQTVLWDQVRYQGNPQEFVWVLPVHQGTRLELSHDEWIAALDASTQPIINAPTPSYGPAYGEGATGAGCGCGSSAATDSESAGGNPPPPPVEVINQQVVGPYETVTLRSTDPKALETWLISHGYEIPASVQPIVDAYTAEGFDFIALRLRPGQGIRAMQPVRVITPGSDPSLPLRMVAAGVGQSVGLTLFVIGEGRYEAQNFPNAVLDETKLIWDFSQDRSNYQDLVQNLMAQNNGTTWVTEYAKRPTVFASSATPPSTAAGGTNPGLADAYFAKCSSGEIPKYTFQDFDAGGDGGLLGDASEDAANDGALSDANFSDANLSDASADASGFDAGNACTAACCGACCAFDDLNVAMTGLHSGDVFVTRLRADLPVDALKSGDLLLAASKDQGIVQNIHNARDPNRAQGAGLAPVRPSRLGNYVTIGIVLLAVGGMLRKRRR